MSLLATVKTETGKVELHHDRGVFTTRGRLLCDARADSTCTILITVERAREWWELADREGHVYLTFPAAEAATPERTLP